MHRTIQAPARRQRGFSLLEALVAFLILSVGMLGIASLQVISLKAGKTAALRTVAVIKVEEMLERIRNNPTQVSAYVVATAGTGTNHGCNDYTGAIKSCTPVQMAEDDIYYWKKELEDALPPNTTASIAVVDPNPGTQPTAEVTVTVNWKERDPEADALIDMSYTATSMICDTTAC